MQCSALEWLGTLFDDRCLDGHGELCGGRVRTILARLWYYKYHPKEDVSIHQFMGAFVVYSQAIDIIGPRTRLMESTIAGENVLTVSQVSKGMIWLMWAVWRRLPVWEGKHVSTSAWEYC
jgi:hypothetical protein